MSNIYWNGSKLLHTSYDFHIEYWSKIAKENNFRGVWSLWGDDLRANSEHPLGENAVIQYTTFWGDETERQVVKGNTVNDLFRACSRLLTNLNEGDHSFIEAFVRIDNENDSSDNVWELRTGS